VNFDKNNDFDHGSSSKKPSIFTFTSSKRGGVNSSLLFDFVICENRNIGRNKNNERILRNTILLILIN
jgi:hypothetical protein